MRARQADAFWVSRLVRTFSSSSTFLLRGSRANDRGALRAEMRDYLLINNPTFSAMFVATFFWEIVSLFW